MFIIYASKNDIANEQSPLIFQSIFRQFILTICRFFVSYISIAYISLKSNLSRINIKLLFHDVTFIHIWSDILSADNNSLHMNSKGYAFCAKAVTTYLQSVFFKCTIQMN
ncbi:unnamed protein product [Rotaria sordida]|uniref:Uncharacterized protein n=1 Tax=Rotaria sordida TaxID=392033 RepID=A0A820GYI3_9BILA|nr:unnamed protein product [Rotaria sordida]